MPRRDGVGPIGKGSQIGRGFWFWCSKQENKNNGGINK